jgi:DNA replication protein DnaC
MTNPDPHAALREHLAELRLEQIAEIYPEVLNEAARKNCSPLDVLVTLVAAEVTARRERALQRRIAAARLQTQDPGRIRSGFPETHPQTKSPPPV